MSEAGAGLEFSVFFDTHSSDQNKLKNYNGKIPLRRELSFRFSGRRSCRDDGMQLKPWNTE